VHSEITAEHFITLLEQADFRGAVIDAEHVFMDIAKDLELETPLDTSKSQSQGVNVGVSYNLGTETATGSFGVNNTTREAAWAEKQTGIRARKTAWVNVGGKVNLRGSYLDVGIEGEPITANFNGSIYKFYEIPVPEDGDCAFHALGLNRQHSIKQLLEYSEDADIAKLIAQEFNCALREPNYLEFKSSLPIMFIEKFTYLDGKYKKQSALLNEYVNQINNKYNPTIRHSADYILNNLVAISETINLTIEEQQRLRELGQARDLALEELLQFLGRKENLATFINTYINGINSTEAVFWLGFDEKGKNRGLMEALAIINKINFKIWRLQPATKDKDGNLIASEAAMLYQFLGNQDSDEYRNLLFKGHHFNALTLSPGSLRATEVTGQTVENRDTTKSTGFSMSGIPLNGDSGEKSQKFDLGLQGQYSNLRDKKTQVNKPSILGEWDIHTTSDLSDINRDADQTKSFCQEKRSGVFVSYAHGVFKDLFGTEPAEPEPVRVEVPDVEIEMDREDAPETLTAEQEQQVTEKEKTTELLEKGSYLDAAQELGKSLVSAFNTWRTNIGKFIGREVFIVIHEGGITATETANILQVLKDEVIDFSSKEINRAFDSGVENTATAKSIKKLHSRVVNYIADEAITINHGGGLKETQTARATMSAYDKGVDWWDNTSRLDKSKQIGSVLGKHGPSLILSFGSGSTIKAGAQILSKTAGAALDNGKKVAKASSSKLLSQFEKFKQSQPKTIIISASTPAEIFHGYGELSARQARHLVNLQKPGDVLNLLKSDINVTDLAALTAKTGDEFYMFTLGSRRTIVRGYSDKFTIEGKLFNNITQQGWRLSAHTHPGTANKVLLSSGADRATLQVLGQEQSVIVNSAAKRRIFTKDGLETDLGSTCFNIPTPKI